MPSETSIAIETSCRAGGLVLAEGRQILGSVSFDASSRHTVHLISRLSELVAEAGLAPGDLDHVYVSAGPGSFTGLRIGISVARTMCQTLPRLKCVAVPSAQAIAENARQLDWEHLGVLLAAKEEQTYAALFTRREGTVCWDRPGAVMPVSEFLEIAPRPLLLMGEALEHCQLSGPGISIADPSLYVPTAEGLWRVGSRLAAAGQFTEPHRIVPIYGRRPEAVRLWENREPAIDKGSR